MSKYKYEYDENIELSTYHPTSQSFYLIFVNLLNFSIYWTLKALS